MNPQTNPYEVASVVIAGIGCVVAIVGLVLVYQQLRQLVESLKLAAAANRTSELMAVLAMEEGLARSRAELASASVRMGEVAANKDSTPGQVEIAKLSYQEKIEQYLNAADRLCACIARGIVDERQYKQDYQKWINEVVEKHKERLGAGTRYRNLMRVHDAWADDKLASKS